MTGTTTVVIAQTSTDTSLNGSYSEAFKFNANQMLTSDAITLNEGAGALPVQTTTYAYGLPGTTRSTVNGFAPWGKVTRIGYPDRSWVAYDYQDGMTVDDDGNPVPDPNTPATGWVTEQMTPFKNGASTAGEDANVTTYYTYDASDSGNGQGADPMNLIEQPRKVESTVLGVTTGITYIRVGGGAPPVAGTENALNLLTRTATTIGTHDDITTWDNSVFQTKTTITPTVQTVDGPSGKSQVAAAWNGSAMVYTDMESWMGTTLANTESDVNPFGGLMNGKDAELGSAYQSSTVTTLVSGSPIAHVDAYGRPLLQTLAGGLTISNNYDADSWFGPSSITQADGSITNYQYNPMGEVTVKTIFAQSSHSVKYEYKYDLAGHVIALTTTPVDASGNGLTASDAPPAVTNSYFYDGLGRLIKEIDNVGGDATTGGRLTTYTFTSSASTGTTEVITYPNTGDNETIVTYLDGSRASDTGPAVTPTYYDEGIAVGGKLSDVSGSPMGSVAPDTNIKTNSTWTSVTSNGANNLSRTFSNMLGEAYLTQQSTSNPLNNYVLPMADAVTSYDGNGRPTKYVDFDGTTTYTGYDPVTGQATSTFVDMNGNGKYDGGTDRKTIARFVNQTTAGSPASVVPTTTPAGSVSTITGVETKVLAATGVQTSDSLSTNGGLTNIGINNGLTTTTVDAPGAANHWTETTTNPDGTKLKDFYTDGNLAEEETFGTNGTSMVSDETMLYNGLDEMTSSADGTGTTSYGYFSDGTESSITRPGHDTESVTSLDKTTNAPTTTQRADGSNTNTPQNSLGLTQSQSGSGVLGVNYGYDTGTGALNSLTMKRTATDSLSAATTSWLYEPSTGLLNTKTFADGSVDKYTYNSKLQLSGVSEPGITASSFKYSGDGALSDMSLTDGSTGIVSSHVQPDELGNAAIVSDTDNGKAFTEMNLVNPLGQNYQNIFGSAGNVTVQYDYYPSTGYGSSGSPQALQTMSVKSSPTGSTLASTTYGYGTDGQLHTISINGVTYTINYNYGADQIGSISAQATGVSNTVQTNYHYDSTDGSRLSQISVSGALGSVFLQTLVGGTSDNYTKLDQSHEQDVARKNADGSTTSDHLVYGYSSSKGDALTSVEDIHGTHDDTTTYAYDDAGNPVLAVLGAANKMNQLGSLGYNGRGDQLDDLNDSGVADELYAYDAEDRLISAAPANPTTSSDTEEKLGYDSSGRILWEDVYSFAGGSGNPWTFSYTRHFVWDGNQLVDEMDGNNNLTVGYTYGPTGLLGVTDYTQSTPKTYVAVSDYSGNVVELIDPSNGSVAADYHYDAWGAPTGEHPANGPAAAICSFRGKGYFVLPQLDRLGFAPNPSGDGSDRVLDFDTHQFMQRDSAGEVDGGSNLHDAMEDDPINYDDFDGLSGENIAAAEGRVKGAAIEEFYAAKGAFRQQAVERTINKTIVSGKADLKFGSEFSEIGPASPTGVADKVAQLNSIDAADRGSIYLYRQEGVIPKSGAKVEYVKLTPQQGRTLAKEISSGTTKTEGIWNRATQLAGEDGVLTTTVSDKAAEYAGRVYLRGELMVLDYASGTTAVAAPAEAATEAEAGVKLLGGGGAVIGAAAVLLTAPSTAQAAVINPLDNYSANDVLKVDLRQHVVATKTFNANSWGLIFGVGGYLIVSNWNSEHAEDIQSSTVLLTRRELDAVLSRSGAHVDDGSLWYDRRLRISYGTIERATPEEVEAWRAARNKKP